MFVNFAAFQSFVTNLSPVTSSFSWNAMSSPSLLPPAQYLSASAEYFLSISCGSMMFPLLLLIFSPCGSITYPDSTMSFHGFFP